jgi:glycerol-3-phosphate dehydrogenase
MRSNREGLLREAAGPTVWDVVVIGGGATGLGTAVEAASRGYRTLLLERGDFAKGTSSRSTKLVHGGVRYLEQMNVTLVMDALRERGYMLRNAPHLVRRQPFIVPIYRAMDTPYFGLGLKVYEWMSGKLSFGASRMLSRAETIERLPTVEQAGLRGGVLYLDGQFDDARYAISLLLTLLDLGGVALNHAGVVKVLERDGRAAGVRVRDAETGNEWEVQAKAVVNAAGVFAEQVLRLDGEPREDLLAISQGSHFVLPRTFLPGPDALMVPKTADGRVLFAIPWHEHLVVGTTDVGVPRAEIEPRSSMEEQEFLRQHIRRYLGRDVVEGDVLSMWSGLRPLVKAGNAATAKISRDHKVLVATNGMVTVVGGKWTTYRRMGQDAIDRVAQVCGWPAVASRTEGLRLHGATESEEAALGKWEGVYGTDAAAVRALSAEAPELEEVLHPRLPYRRRDVVWAVRREMARTTEDVLARRLRALFLDARAAIEAAPTVAAMVGAELGREETAVAKDLAAFKVIADGYLYREGAREERRGERA